MLAQLLTQTKDSAVWFWNRSAENMPGQYVLNNTYFFQEITFVEKRDEIFGFMQTTFLNKTNPDLIEQEVNKALDYLVKNEFIELITEYREDEQKIENDQRPPLPFYDVTIMGSATYRYFN